MTTYKVNSIGTICNNEKGAFIQLEAPYILALRALDGFSHINVLWWFSDFDYMSGLIQIAYIDANDKTPILDIKPYTPSLDRVENPQVPDWCSHWPHSLEESASFAWESEFNF